MTSIEYLCQDRDYVKAEIIRIRETFTKTAFTFKNIDAARQALTWMLLYSPVDLQSVIESTLREIEMREEITLFGALKAREK